MTKKIEITLAQPIDGEGVENINMEKYTAEVLAYVCEIHDDARVEIDWISNDGTAETSVFTDGADDEIDFQSDVEETVMLAEGQFPANLYRFCTGIFGKKKATHRGCVQFLCL